MTECFHIKAFRSETQTLTLVHGSCYDVIILQRKQKLNAANNANATEDGIRNLNINCFY